LYLSFSPLSQWPFLKSVITCFYHSHLQFKVPNSMVDLEQNAHPRTLEDRLFLVHSLYSTFTTKTFK
jgi:hypothetical protein